MHRIDNATAAAVLPAYAAPGPVNPGYFQNCNPGTGAGGTMPGADWFNDLQENLFEILLRAGLAATKGRKEDLADAILRLQGRWNFISVSANRALANSETGSLLSVSSSGGNRTVTLPQIVDGSGATVKPGAVYAVVKISTDANSVTLQGSGGQQVQGAGSLALTAARELVVVMADSNQWVVLGKVSIPDATTTQKGLVRLGTTAEHRAFALSDVATHPAGIQAMFTGPAQSLVQNGYQTLPGGTILQWGSGVYNNAATISFPIAFPTACRGISTVDSGASGGMTAHGIYTVLPASFRLFTQGGGSMNLHWHAIGH